MIILHSETIEAPNGHATMRHFLQLCRGADLSYCSVWSIWMMSKSAIKWQPSLWQTIQNKAITQQTCDIISRALHSTSKLICWRIDCWLQGEAVMGTIHAQKTNKMQLTVKFGIWGCIQFNKKSNICHYHVHRNKQRQWPREKVAKTLWQPL